MKKEECIWRAFRNTPGAAVISTDLKNAMDEFAKQTAIAFADWILKEELYLDDGKWWKHPFNNAVSFTSQDIYNQFIEQQNK